MEPIVQLVDMTWPGRYDNVCRGIMVSQYYITGRVGRLCCL